MATLLAEHGGRGEPAIRQPLIAVCRVFVTMLHMGDTRAAKAIK